MSVIDFRELCGKLDPNYKWVRAMLDREARPLTVVGFSISLIGEKWFTSFGDCPVALLHKESGEWVVAEHIQETGRIREPLFRYGDVGPALDRLLDTMIDFQKKRKIALHQEEVRRQAG